MSYPTPYDVAALAQGAVLTTMKPANGRETGSDKSGPGEWATKDVEEDPGYHYMRAIRHLTTAWNIEAGTEDPGDEDARDHLHRAITRATFCLAVLNRRCEEVSKLG